MGRTFSTNVTFSIDDSPNVAAGTREWVDKVVAPGIEGFVDKHGHLALDTYVSLVDDKDLAKGILINDDPPRFSTGFLSLTGRPTMLVELHMLKDYKTRVTGNYWTLVGLMEVVNRDAEKLLALNAKADMESKSWTGKEYPLVTAWAGKTAPIAFKGYEYKLAKSEVSGADWVQYTHTPKTFEIPQQVGYKVSTEVIAPDAYIVPAAWVQVINRLSLHGLKLEKTSAEWNG